jgi:hypothetical protein
MARWLMELLPHDHVEFATCPGGRVDMITVEEGRALVARQRVHPGHNVAGAYRRS